MTGPALGLSHAAACRRQQAIARPAGAAYVCRGTVCFDPVTDYAELKTPLWSRV